MSRWQINEKIRCHFQSNCGFFVQKINKQDSWFFSFLLKSRKTKNGMNRTNTYLFGKINFWIFCPLKSWNTAWSTCNLHVYSRKSIIRVKLKNRQNRIIEHSKKNLEKLGKSTTENANHYSFRTLENWQFSAENLSTRGQFQAICDNREHPQWPEFPIFVQKLWGVFDF